MSAETRRGALVAGWLVVAAIVVLLISGGTPQREVEASFSNVRGLVRGAEVRGGGVKIGEVRKVWLGADGVPRVRMSVRRDFVLHRGSTASLRLGSLSGEFNRYISLTTGTGASLGSGDVVLARGATQSAVEVDQALDALTPATRADLRAVLRGLRQSLDGRGPQLSLTLRNSAGALDQLAAAAGDVAADGQALRSLVADTHRVTAALADRPQRLAEMVDELGALLHTTAARETALGTAVRNLPAALREPRRALAGVSASIPDLRAAIRAAAPGLHELVGASGELRTALVAGTPALHEARGLTRTAPADLKALTPLLREARPVLSQLTPVLRRAGPMLDQARVRLPDFFSFFSNWADFTSNYDASGHGARVGLVFPPAPTNVLNPSGNGQGQLEAPYLRTPGSLNGEPWNDYAKSFVAGGKAGPDVGATP